MEIEYNDVLLEQITLFDLKDKATACKLTDKIEWQGLASKLAPVLKENKEFFEKEIGGKFSSNNGESWFKKYLDFVSVWPAVVLPTMNLNGYTLDCYIIPMKIEGEINSPVICAYEKPTWPKIGIRLREDKAGKNINEVKNVLGDLEKQAENIIEALYSPFNNYLEEQAGEDGRLYACHRFNFKVLASNSEIGEKECEEILGKELKSLTGNIDYFRLATGLNETKNPISKQLRCFYSVTNNLKSWDTIGITNAKTPEELNLMKNYVLTSRLGFI